MHEEASIHYAQLVHPSASLTAGKKKGHMQALQNGSKCQQWQYFILTPSVCRLKDSLYNYSDFQATTYQATLSVSISLSLFFLKEFPAKGIHYHNRQKANQISINETETPM